MNNAFKPLGLAAAVAAASTGIAHAQTVSVADLGDLALVPYYTVNGNWVTGIHIVNTSAKTQVVKFRFRRAEDSLDALDFNVVMSPKDVYAGYLDDSNEDGAIRWTADDTTCTVPVVDTPYIQMPAIFNADGAASSGYVEIIAMGAPTSETSPIAVGAKHADGTPADCLAVASNFFADGVDGSVEGVVNEFTTYQRDAEAVPELTGTNTYEDSGDALKVSYFIRDRDSGIEFGDNAVHIGGFLTQPSITNQEFGWLTGDLEGFDFPNLNGGVPTAANPERGRFDALRGVLGNRFLVNEWSVNPANGVALDWVVTLPGQYVMMDTPEYYLYEVKDDDPATTCAKGVCDFRDIPVTAAIRNYDREERAPVPDDPQDGELVVSPDIPDPASEVPVTLLSKEVNVITFGEGSVLGVSDIPISDPGVPQPYGWLNLSVASSTAATPSICSWNAAEDVDPVYGPDGVVNVADDAKLAALQGACTPVANDGVPMIGFAAWARSVADNPDASYGRIIEHSYASTL